MDETIPTVTTRQTVRRTPVDPLWREFVARERQLRFTQVTSVILLSVAGIQAAVSGIWLYHEWRDALEALAQFR